MDLGASNSNNARSLWFSYRSDHLSANRLLLSSYNIIWPEVVYYGHLYVSLCNAYSLFIQVIYLGASTRHNFTVHYAPKQKQFLDVVNVTLFTYGYYICVNMGSSYDDSMYVSQINSVYFFK